LLPLIIAGLITLGSGVAGAQPSLRFVDPTATGPGILDLTAFPPAQVHPLWPSANRSHVVAYDASVPRADRLLVFLSGSGALPVQYQHIMQRATSDGYHAVSIAYPNWPAVRDLVADETDPLVAGRIRRERLCGVDEYAGITVDFSNSVQNRLVQLLAHQHAAHPDEGWDQFISTPTSPAWSNIVVSGHSQGAGHAAYLTRDHELAGAILFGGPGDFIDNQQASWLFRPSLTPTERMFAFTHVNDPYSAGFFQNQRTLGLDAFGPIVNVDTGLEPYAGSHMLTSFLAPPPGENAHNAPVLDAALRLDASGNPVYAPVWDYMLSQVVPAPGVSSILLLSGSLAARRRR
jgi:hypothetical protein